jgi:hypothetical protein
LEPSLEIYLESSVEDEHRLGLLTPRLSGELVRRAEVVGLFDVGPGTPDSALQTDKVQSVGGPSKIRVRSLFVCFMDVAMPIWL